MDGCPASQIAEKDATFIAESRTAMPALIAEVRRLSGALEKIANAVIASQAKCECCDLGVAESPCTCLDYPWDEQRNEILKIVRDALDEGVKK